MLRHVRPYLSYIFRLFLSLGICICSPPTVPFADNTLTNNVHATMAEKQKSNSSSNVQICRLSALSRSVAMFRTYQRWKGEDVIVLFCLFFWVNRRTNESKGEKTSTLPLRRMSERKKTTTTRQTSRSIRIDRWNPPDTRMTHSQQIVLSLQSLYFKTNCLLTFHFVQKKNVAHFECRVCHTGT